jgi:hypothetical protein
MTFSIVHRLAGTSISIIHALKRTHKLLQICKQVVTRLLSSRYQDVFALLVPSCCDKSGTSCYHLVTRLMTVTDLLQVDPTRLIQVFVTSCYELDVINLLTTCYVQTISDLLEQLVASLLASSTLLQDDNNLLQTCQQLGTSSTNTSCWQAARFLRVC